MSQQKQNPLAASNLLIGSAVSAFEVTTLGQPLEVLKTHLAANRNDRLRDAVRKTMDRGGLKGFYQGLIPWAWIESAGAGAVLLYTASAVEGFAKPYMNAGSAGLLGGALGGAAQAYLVMGVCTCMKTAEITRQKVAVPLAFALPGQPAAVMKTPGAFSFFLETYRQGGLRAINKGVNAVALRQMSNWASRIGIARYTEDLILNGRGLPVGTKLSTRDKVVASSVGGALGCWNHPLEVIRVEMQSLKKADASTVARPEKLTIISTFNYIRKENGIKGLFKGVTPRIGLGVWRTVCLVSLGDYVKDMLASREKILTASG